MSLTGSVAAEPDATPETRRSFDGRTGLALGIVGTSYAASWAVVSAAWWANQDASNGFHFRDEGAFGSSTYAGGADKLGHFYSTYVFTRMYSDILEWGGFSRAVSMVGASVLTAAFFTGVEVKDGYAPQYGFSVTDLAANLAGQVTALGFMLVPELDEAVSVKVMYFPSADYARSPSLNIMEDYSGQTYLLAFHLAVLPGVANAKGSVLRSLRYVDVSLGYATRGYAPVPATPQPLRQLTSVGLSLNLQSAFDDLLSAPSEPRPTGSAVVHFINEVYQPPYTRLPVVTYERVNRR